jgi:hypothetical protein
MVTSTSRVSSVVGHQGLPSRFRSRRSTSRKIFAASQWGQPARTKTSRSWADSPAENECPVPQREQDKADADRADESPYVLVWMEHYAGLVDRAKRRSASDIGQHIQHLLVRQCAAKSMHGSE